MPYPLTINHSLSLSLSISLLNTQHNDTQYNDKQHNAFDYNDTQPNFTQGNCNKHDDTQYNDNQFYVLSITLHDNTQRNAILHDGVQQDDTAGQLMLWQVSPYRYAEC
jgi:hypothetical protein